MPTEPTNPPAPAPDPVVDYTKAIRLQNPYRAGNGQTVGLEQADGGDLLRFTATGIFIERAANASLSEPPPAPPPEEPGE